MKIFLDDVRIPRDCLSYMHSRIGSLNPIYAEEWSIVKTYEEFKKLLYDNIHIVTHISFDHDLADAHYDPSMYEMDTKKYNKLYDKFEEKTGYHAALYTKGLYSSKGLKLPTMFCHSMNPVGTLNIMNVFI